MFLFQGHYQSAREFLNEAHTAAVSFEDVPLQARILYLLGTLSLEEAQYGQAVNLCKKAQVNSCIARFQWIWNLDDYLYVCV